MTSHTTVPDAQSGPADAGTITVVRTWRPVGRALLFLGGGFGFIVLFVVGITLFQLNRIPRVEFDQATVEDRIDEASEEVLAEIQEAITTFEAETIVQEAADEAAAIEDGDLLATAREELSDSEITASYLVPFASGTPVADSVHDTYLLLGTDLSKLRADVIIFVMLPRDGSEPVLTSLPRDLYLFNRCKGQNSRINAALFGCSSVVNGPELVALMVEGYTGVPVDHFAIVDFDGFTDVIDAFGGLEICVDNPVRDRKSELSLPAGCTDADGEVVLQWVRSRATQERVDGTWGTMDGVDDFARQQRQQETLIDIANKLGSFDSITSLTNVAAGLANAVTFDDGMDLTELVTTAWALKDIDLSNITRVQPGFRNYITESGAFVVVPTKSFTDAFRAATIKIDSTAAS